MLASGRSSGRRLAARLTAPSHLRSFRPVRHDTAVRAVPSRFPAPRLARQDRRKAAVSPWTLVVALALLSGGTFLGYRTLLPDPSATSASAQASEQSTTNSQRTYHIHTPDGVMLVSDAPGRPGNLTHEQEIKLREFWVAVLKVFGVVAPTIASAPIEALANGHEGTDTPKTESSVASEDPASRTRADTVGSEKHKKKRLGLFSRKKNSKKDEEVDASGPDTDASSKPATPAPGAAAEDKYDQTAQFKQALASQSPESLRAAFWSMAKHDHPDALLLRFLRARKWDIQNALVMLVSTMQWRSKEMHVDDEIMREGEGAAIKGSKSSDPSVKREADDFLTQIRLGKSYLHGLDKNGRPICFCQARLHHKGEQTEASLERYTVFLIETARLVMPPPVDTACILFDMSGFSMANMDYAPVRFMIKCFEANYPESLGVVLVHKAPWVFQGIWTIIRGWLDPVVASKVNFTKNIDELEAFIPRSRIPKGLDGDEDWEWKYPEPIVEDEQVVENKTMEDVAGRETLLEERKKVMEEFESLTQRWITEAGKAEAGPGEEEVKRIGQERNQVADRLADNYWKLDPFIRARSSYDRMGVIGELGKLNFYPPVTGKDEKSDETDKGVVQPGLAKVETSADDVD